MSYNKINIGQQANDGTGDSIRAAFQKADSMFQELYQISTGGTGLRFTKFLDTPQAYIPSSVTTATILAVDNYGNTLTQKSLVAGSGIYIVNSSTNQLIINATTSSLFSDTNPTLSRNLLGGGIPGQIGTGYQAKYFNDPSDAQDLATKNYVDTNSPYSSINIYVSTNGYSPTGANGIKSFASAGIPSQKWGRSLAYAFRYINDAAQLAESVINTASSVLSSYEQYMTYNNGLITATIYAVVPSPVVPGSTRILFNYGDYSVNGTDQFLAFPTPNVRPGQYFLGGNSTAVGFIQAFGDYSTVGISYFNSATCYRDTGLIIDAVAFDMAFPNSKSQVTFAGLQYWSQSNYVGAIASEITTTTSAITQLKFLVQKIVQSNTTFTKYSSGSQITNSNHGGATEASMVSADVQVILDILNNGTKGVTDKIVPNSLTSSTTATVWYSYNLLQQNKSFLQQEINAYITATNAGYVYDSIKCARDVGYMVDSISFDLLYGGNRQAIQSGVYYYGYSTSSVIAYELTQTLAAYNHINAILPNIIQGIAITPTVGNTVGQVTAGYGVGGATQVTTATTLLSTITNIIANGPSVASTPSPISLVANSNTTTYSAARLLEANRTFIQAETLAYISYTYSKPVEYYDVYNTGTAFVPGEPVLFSYQVPKPQITILVESGIYEEQLPIKLAANVSLKGEESRRTIIQPAPLTSTSKWAKTFFRRDNNFDGLTNSSPANAGQGLAIPGQEYGYHYLTDATNPNSTPKLNSQMDVFLLNDANIVTGLTSQGHGGFMCVFDPQGQILTKSPYIYKATSFSFSINQQVFSGGVYVDGFVGNLQIVPAAATTGTYYTGTYTISVASPAAGQGLYARNPPMPVTFYSLGNRYQVAYVTNYNQVAGTAVLNINPYFLGGGISYPSGVIPIASGGGTGYSTAPTVIFSAPDQAAGHTAAGVANLNAGVVTSITVTNPGSGYTNPVNVSFQGGGPVTTATSFTISTSSIKQGFIGYLPSIIELNTPGNKSMLTADFTQMNDLGYGIISTNNGTMEAVSVFTYYNHTGYYAKNGGAIRSLNGSTAFGDYALKAEGADPNEVPTIITLQADMISTATVVNANWTSLYGGINATNNTGSNTLIVRNPYSLSQGFAYPDISVYANSQVEFNYGLTSGGPNNGTLGLQQFNVVSATTVSNTVTNSGGWLIQLQLATSLVGGSNGLPAPINSGTIVTIRGQQQFMIQGLNRRNLIDPNLTAVLFSDSTSSYSIAAITDISSATSGYSDLSLSGSWSYVGLSTWNSSTYVATATSTSIRINPLSTTSGDGARLIKSLGGSSSTQYIFGWNGTVHRVTGYTYATGGLTYDTITFTPALTSTVTNYSLSNPYINVSLPAGIRYLTTGSVYTKISTMRATGADMFNIGVGGYDSARYPNDIYGPSTKLPNASNERTSIGQGRVFAVTTDQDGNFRVGDFFAVNQASGSVTINSNINLSGVSGLQFQKGVLVNEFSTDDTLGAGSNSSVPVQTAIIGYINHRLGLDVNNGTVARIGSGYLDLNGNQAMTGGLKMAAHNITMSNGAIDMGGSGQSARVLSGQITNLTTTTTGGSLMDVINKGYADTKISIAGTSTVDSSTGVITPANGIMTGGLILNGDPMPGNDGSRAASKRYVDQIRQITAMSDVKFSNPTDTDFVIFGSNTFVANTSTVGSTTSTAYPIWNYARQVINATVTPTSDIGFSRSGNNIAVTINANTITNAQICSSAGIQQSKLTLNCSIICSSAPTSYQQNSLGLSNFDSTYFCSCYGWITLCTPSTLVVNKACCVGNTLSAGTGICACAGANTFNGSAAATWCVYAGCANTINGIVCRDGSGNFAAGTICAALVGNAASATYASCTCGNAASSCCSNLAFGLCGAGAAIYGTMGTSYSNAVQVREMGLGGTQNGSGCWNPRLAFHWSGRVASSITMCNDGNFAFADNPGTGLMNVCASTFVGALSGNASSASAISGYNNPDSAVSASTIAYRTSGANLCACCFISSGCFSGLASSAKYADLAENYQADCGYKPCTVLEFGGVCEVTVASTGTRAVAGVVSTNPAYRMNDGLVGDNVVALALTGRVPCLVKGPIKKGDMLVSAGGGYAMADPDPKLGSVIGKALEDFNSEEGVIEVVVGRM
jgi:hypothetical protein